MNSMDVVRKRFVLLATLSVFVLLSVLLTIINGVNFTMAAADADAITMKLADRRGAFDKPGTAPRRPDGGTPPLSPDGEGVPVENTLSDAQGVPVESAFSDTQGRPAENALSDAQGVPLESAFSDGQNAPMEMAFSGVESVGLPSDGGLPEEAPPPDADKKADKPRRKRGPRVGPMGPDSPELASSTRYFTYAFDHDGGAEQIAFAISAVEPEDAEAWADSLRVRQQTGWTRTTYRYRVYHAGGRDFVTVIDQGRELLPSLRILTISLAGGLAGLVVSFLVLASVSRRLFQPLEEADRKQKRFIADAERDFKVPLTVIDADAEVLERESGENERTRSIHQQVRRMASLLKGLSSLALFDEEELDSTDLQFSEFARAAADGWRERFREKGMTLETEIPDGVTIRGDGQSIAEALEELLENAWKFGKTAAFLTVRQDGERVEIRVSNDTDLPERSVEQVFDRFTRLENAGNVPGAGLGLSRVKEIVRAHNGRAAAKSAGGSFTLTIRL